VRPLDSAAARLERLGLLAGGTPAPAWTTMRWFGHAGAPLTPEALRGRVIVLYAFQMLCPGCVHHGLPQVQRIARTFSPDDVAVVGLHTVFEHHAAMTPVSLEAYLYENRVTFPVGVDAPAADAGDPIPQTMRRYGLQGTPSLVLIDRTGHVRRQGIGVDDDLSIGASIAALVLEA
jgi:hypothetical protein